MRKSPPLLLFSLVFCLPFLAGCTAAPSAGAASGDASPGDDAGDDVALQAVGDDATSLATAGDAASAFPSGNPGDAGEGIDAARAGPPFDAGPGGTCALPPGAGDLTIDELMIESVAGTGDYGEWLEVKSNLPCAVDLRGLHGECPNGAKVRTFDVTDDVWIPAQGTFVVADSVDPALNHDLPGMLLVWSGQPGDVLRNKGGTITLQQNGVLVDTLTFPALALTVGAAVAFPASCAPTQRSDWAAWQASNASWFPGFFGTPNAPNTDVQCP